jgi:hypothetical protein
MTEIEKKIQEAKIKLYNEKQNIKIDISEKMTMLKVREAELCLIESFIDQLNDLKSKKMERSTYEKLNQKKEDDTRNI